MPLSWSATHGLIETNAVPLTAPVTATPTLDGQHALEWSYLCTGADEKADALLSRPWRLCETDLNSRFVVSSEVLHYCA